MKRALLLAAALAVLVGFPAAAQAGTFTGVVIAKDAQRKAVVTASANGVVRTVRSARVFRQARIGQRVSLRAAALPDGTFAAQGLRALGRARHTRFDAVVVKSAAGGLIVSAGHSTFAVRLRGAAKLSIADGGKLQPGDRVSCDADIGAQGLSSGQSDLHNVGHVDQIDLEGIYLSTTGNVLDLAVVHRGLVHVTIPDGIAVPKLSAGDEVSLVVTVEPGGSFLLVRADNEDASSGGDGGNGGVDINTHDNQFTVNGILASVTDGFVSVKVERHPEAVRCAVPSGVDLSGFTVGELVEMHCHFVDGRFVLASLTSKEASLPEDGQAEFSVSGFISTLSSDGVGVNVQGHDRPVTCARPASMDILGFTVGDFVKMDCRRDGAHYVISALESDAAKIGDHESYFTFRGVIVDLALVRISVQVEHHPSPVTCAVPAGIDVRGFAIGDTVEIHCHNDGAGFRVSALSSDSAQWPENDMPSFTLNGILQAIGTDSVGVQVPRHPELVRCAMPVGTNLSGFAIGDTVELHCHFHDGRFNLAELHSEHADLKLEN